MKMKPQGKNFNESSTEEDHRTNIQKLIVFTLPLLLNCFYIENVLSLYRIKRYLSMFFFYGFNFNSFFFFFLELGLM